MGAPPPGCCRCNHGPWPIAWAAVQLELLALTQPAWSPATSCSDSFAVAGFHSSSHTSALLAEFARVADEGDTTLSADSNTTEKPVRGRRQARGSAAAGAQSGKAKQPKAAAAGAPGRSHRLEGVGCSADADVAATAADPAVWLCNVMRAAAAACQQPLLLRQACRLLAGAFRAIGAVQAALLYHHMHLGEQWLLRVTDTGSSRPADRVPIMLHDQHAVQSAPSEPLHVCRPCDYPAAGASTTQRQLILAASQLSRNSEGVVAADSSVPAAATLQQQSQLLSYAEVLQQAASAAAQACDSTDDPSARLEALAGAVDGAATAWLTLMLQQLPHGTAVCTVSIPDSSRSGQAGGLLLSRVVLDAATSSVAQSLLVQVPGPCAAAR